MRRPNRSARAALSQGQRNSLAARAHYTGSPEHKSTAWWGGHPQAGARRQKTTVCPLTTDTDRQAATTWVRRAIRDGQYKFVDGDGQFPKHLWFTDKQGQTWQGRCLNRASGEYKGWPISEAERREIFD